MEEDTQIAKKNISSQLVPYLIVLIVVAVVVLTFQITHQYQLITVFQFILPVPVVFITIRYSLRVGGAIIAGATAITSMLSGYRIGIHFFLGSGIVALIFALMFHQNASATATVSCVTLYYIAIGIVTMYMQTGITYEAYTQRLVMVFKEHFVSFYKTNEVAGENLEAQLDALARILSITSPVISALIISLITYMVIRIWLKLLRFHVAPLTLFHQWKVSDHLVWLFVLGGILYHPEPTRIIGISILLTLIFLYYFEGSAIIAYFLKQKQTPKLLQISVYLFLFMQVPYILKTIGMRFIGNSNEGISLPLPFIILVASVGLSNVWIDFRKYANQLSKPM